MSFWYDIKHKNYSSNANESWLRHYVDKTMESFDSENDAKLSSHSAGTLGRHSASDIDCADGKNVQNSIDNETSARIAEDTAIKQSLANEISTRTAEDAAIKQSLTNEISTRTAEETSIKQSLANETTQRTAEDVAIRQSLTNETAERKASESAFSETLNQKVDKVSGKSLSSNDYTTAEKNKLADIESGAQVNTVASVAGKTGKVTLSKSDVGLGNVENTSDANKPISTATRAALNEKADITAVLTKTNTVAFTPTANYQPATKKYVDDNISAAGGGDMMKAVYDMDNDGIIDDVLKITNNTTVISNEYGGFAAGKGASTEIEGGNIAIGHNAIAGGYDEDDGGEPGSIAIGSGGIARYHSISMGANASATAQGISIGENSSASQLGIALGNRSKATTYKAIQLGAGENSQSKTLQIFDYQLLTADGNIPRERLINSIGLKTSSTGEASLAAGYSNTTLAYQTKLGQCAKEGTAGQVGGTTGDALIIGNGTSSSLSNAFRVTYAGEVYGSQAYSSSGADYAEYFEWLDGNPNNEDRRGRIVTLDGNKIRYATADDDYILGITSANPCVKGDVHPDDWQGKYLTDVFGRRLTQVVHVDAEYEDREITDPETGEKITERIMIHDECDAVQWILNPAYNSDKEYISREERPEWSAVGTMGKLVVVDDGTCEVNGYCCAGENGVATKATGKSSYRVMERIDNTHIKVWVC